MTDIKPTYVTFEQAKWLKEKGFDEQCLTIYQDGEILQLKSTISNSQFMTSRNYSATEQHVVVEWLRINHGIWIEVKHNPHSQGNKGLWEYLVTPIFEKGHILTSLDSPKRIGNGCGVASPQEAYSAAFDYILNNLI
jgi:hypothetical protein